MAIRAASQADLDSITWVSIAATEGDPLFVYRFPHRHQYPEDQKAFTHKRYSDTMAAGDAVMVFEAASQENSSVKEIVAFSTWLWPRPDKDGVKQQRPADQLQRRDGDPARMVAFRAAYQRAKSEHLDRRYGNSQMYLGMLACHPSYQRRGAGKMLVQWGIDKARANGIKAVTLHASPDGRLLYTRMGFQVLGTFRTQLEGEEEYVEMTAMALEL